MDFRPGAPILVRADTAGCTRGFPSGTCIQGGVEDGDVLHRWAGGEVACW